MVDLCSPSELVDGILLPISCNVERYKSGLNYKAQSDDIFVCVYPKSGTTWMQVILHTLLNNGEAFDQNIDEYFARTPFLELVGEEGIMKMHRPYVIKTHLPFDLIPQNAKAKYIFVIRNPKDVCVSYYFFLLNFHDKEYDPQSFNKFFESFINGNIFYGDYFIHLHSIWKHKDDNNVFLTSYEHMKNNLDTIVRQLAQFLNIELTDQLFQCILTYSSFDYMKEHFHKTYSAKARSAINDQSTSAPLPIDKDHLQMADKCIIVRKGLVGGWAKIMTEEQSQRLEKIFKEKTKDLTGIEKFISFQ